MYKKEKTVAAVLFSIKPLKKKWYLLSFAQTWVWLMYQPSGTQTFLVQLSQIKQIYLEKDERWKCDLFREFLRY